MSSVLRIDSDVDWRRVANIAGLLLLLIVVGTFVVASVPQFAGADESYVVLSDSMSPSIDAGAVVFVNEVPANEIQRDDVITYEFESVDGQTTTHRVVGIEDQDDIRQFVTKGDANENPDATPVPASAVIGKVSFHIPLIGYVISFANTQWGILALVVVPAILLVGLEIRDLLYTDNEPEDES